MADEPRNSYRYRILRYTPNLVRDEWVNVGVLLEEVDGIRKEIRLIEEPRAFTRIRQIHPNADQEVLHSLPHYMDSLLALPVAEAELQIRKLDQAISNVLQFSPQKGSTADDFDVELDRLYHEMITPPRRQREGIVESTREWIKSRLNDVFRRRRVPGLERNIPAEQFTEPGDPLKLDYGYTNGVRGFLQALTLGRDPGQAKVLAYTAQRVRLKIPDCEFTAITETEPVADKSRHQFVVRLLEEQNIEIVPLNRIEKFAEDLRLRLQ
jgi:hypothetical protein